MEQSTILAILKIVFIILFVLIVLIVGSLPIRLKTFKSNRFLKSMGTTFAGALFVNVALIHILPESSDTIEQHLKQSSGQDQVFPLANLLVMLGFLTTIFFTRIIATHQHHDDQHSHQHSVTITQPLNPQQNTNAQIQNQQTILTNPDQQEEVDQPLEPVEEKPQNHQDTYFLTVAIYFHTIFEGIAIGVQDNIAGFLSTAVAIAFHKWADALSMGIHYRNRNVSKKISYGLIIGQAALNALAITIGWGISSFGQLVQAIFLSISAGTFLAISTMQMLGEQLHRPRYRFHKFILLLFSTAFISMIWFFQNAIFNNTDQN